MSKPEWRKTSFSELKANILNQPLPPLPSKEAPSIKVGDVADLEADADLSAQMVLFSENTLLPWVFHAVPWLQKVMERSKSPGGQRFLDMPCKSAEGKKSYRQQMEEIKEELAKWQNHEEPLYSQYTNFGEALALVESANNREALLDVLDKLVTKGVLKEDPAGEIIPFKDIHLSVSDCFPYVEDAPARIKESIMAMAKKIKSEFFQSLFQQEEELRQQTTCSSLQVWQKREGKCCLKVEGGLLLVSANQTQVRILNASGISSNGFRKMLELEEKYQLPGVITTILWENVAQAGQLRPSDYRLPKEELYAPPHVKDAQDRKAWWDSKALAWRLVWQGFKNALPDYRNPQWKELGEQVTSTDLWDFHVARRPGKYLVGFAKWKHKTKEKEFNVESPAILVEVFEDQKGLIKLRIAATTPSCQEMFAPYTNEQWEIKERYEGTPLLVGSFLRANFAFTVEAKNS